jgi:tubulin polyglutamylase TTLL6/13
MIMQKHQPKEYDFFPQTYMLPTDMHDYKKQFRRANPENVPTFIVKPSHDCQGRGIYLMKQFDELKDPEQSVVA